ncbi:hypothetical protein THOM_1191 [Trachipleistophora hominis]|uniref:Uncharacterized protein n=1 Tax=Trachipleistophora hominis TaxID=72359 RepID=L7JWP4_TRAHO|nr:hypothetical protein THOM_1191 [Trachipleistophora hominis]
MYRLFILVAHMVAAINNSTEDKNATQTDGRNTNDESIPSTYMNNNAEVKAPSLSSVPSKNYIFHEEKSAPLPGKYSSVTKADKRLNNSIQQEEKNNIVEKTNETKVECCSNPCNITETQIEDSGINREAIEIPDSLLEVKLSWDDYMVSEPKNCATTNTNEHITTPQKKFTAQH